MRIGIIVAMEKELRQLKTLLSSPVTERQHGKEFYKGHIHEHEVILQQCGIGKVNATIGAVEMINAYHPDLVVSSGCAGGASTRLRVTDVVVGTQYAYHDVYCGKDVAYGQLPGLPAIYSAPGSLVEKALSLDCGVSVHRGLIVSGDWFVTSKEKIGEILSHFPDALAVDMESCAIAQTCHLYGVPFVSFRIISDIPLLDTDASQYYDFWDRMADGSFQVTQSFISQL